MPEPPAPPLERILTRSESGPQSIVDLALGVNRQRPPASDRAAPPRGRAALHRRFDTSPIPAPRTDWASLVCGTKPMYRTYSDSHHRREAPLFPPDTEFPRPGLIYSQTGHARRYDAALMVITSYRMEPLGAISREDVQLERFDMLGQFIRYWKRRYGRLGWRPADMISVVELRPWEEQDDEEQGAWLLRHLFGEWL